MLLAKEKYYEISILTCTCHVTLLIYIKKIDKITSSEFIFTVTLFSKINQRIRNKKIKLKKKITRPA